MYAIRSYYVLEVGLAGDRARRRLDLAARGEAVLEFDQALGVGAVEAVPVGADEGGAVDAEEGAVV